MNATALMAVVVELRHRDLMNRRRLEMTAVAWVNRSATHVYRAPERETWVTVRFTHATVRAVWFICGISLALSHSIQNWARCGLRERR